VWAVNRHYRSNTSGGEKNAKPYIVQDRTFTDTGLKKGMTYYYQVSAWTLAGESALSNEVSVVADDDDCSDPQAAGRRLPGNTLKVQGDGSKAILSWAPAPEAIFYDLFRSNTSGGEAGTKPYKILKQPSFIDTDLVPGTTYFYQVTAESLAGQSALSNEVSVTADQPSGVNTELPPQSPIVMQLPPWLGVPPDLREVPRDKNDLADWRKKVQKWGKEKHIDVDGILDKLLGNVHNYDGGNDADPKGANDHEPKPGDDDD
jgi:hypothetical protein